jgi:molybdopterin-guanine dinucleotide biosynthesis protein A
MTHKKVFISHETGGFKTVFLDQEDLKTAIELFEEAAKDLIKSLKEEQPTEYVTIEFPEVDFLNKLIIRNIQTIEDFREELEETSTAEEIKSFKDSLRRSNKLYQIFN